MKRNHIIIVLLAGCLAASVRGSIAVSLAGSISLVSSITENFDSMGTTGISAPDGWSFHGYTTGSSGTWVSSISASGVAGGATGADLILTTTFDPANTKSATQGYNFALDASNLDRALGTSPTSTKGVALQLQLTNNSGASLSALQVGYDIRRFTAAAAANELPGYWLFYSLDNGATWNNVAALNPVLAGAGVQAPNTIGVSHVPLTPFALADSWANGADLLLRWVDDNSAASSADQIIGLDNVTVTVPPADGLLTRGPYLQKAAPTTMTIRWRSSQPVAGRVRLGLSAANLDMMVDETDATTEHEVALTGLTAGTTYFYSVGSSTHTLAGGDDTCVFTTPPISGTAVNTRVWVLGDAGTGTANQTSVRDAFYTWSGTRAPDLVLQLGDNAYNDGLDSEFQAKVFDIYAILMRKSPFWSCLGNHETAQATSFVDTYPYFSIYTFPKAGECGGVASGTEHYFSWDYGNIHFISLDSMTADRSAAGAMATWLANDLASTTLTWIIAIWHHPPYTRGSHDSDTETPLVEMRQNILPILEAGGVDLVLCGHSHCYERSCLLDGHYGLSTTLTAAMKKNAGDGRPSGNGAYGKPLTGTRNHFGAVYCVTGSAGQIGGGSLDHPAHYISLSQLGSTVIDINGATLNATFLRETGDVADSFSMVKQGGSTPPMAATVAATAVTSRTATLRGSVNPAGTVSTAKFQHGPDASYGNDTVLTLMPDDGLSSQSVSASLTGLTPGAVYHFRVTATNAWGTVDGSDLTFITQTPYEEWIFGKGLSGSQADPAADSETDGRRNLEEWAYGTDPLIADPGVLKLAGTVLVSRGGARIQMSGADASAVFCRRKDFASVGLTYTTQFSADLAAWVSVAGTPVVIAEDSEFEAVSVPFPEQVNGSAPRFFRLLISAQ